MVHLLAIYIHLSNELSWVEKGVVSNYTANLHRARAELGVISDKSIRAETRAIKVLIKLLPVYPLRSLLGSTNIAVAGGAQTEPGAGLRSGLAPSMYPAKR